MRILCVFPCFPGALYDGSAMYERQLLRALRRQGAELEVLTTRAERPQAEGAFDLSWPAELPRRGDFEGIPIRRYDTVRVESIGQLASSSVIRRWGREAAAAGDVIDGSRVYLREQIRRAEARPGRFDVLAGLGRGPIAPRLTAAVLRRAHRFDVLLVGYAPFILPAQAAWAGRVRGRPVVLLPFIHEEDPYHHFRALYRDYRAADAVLALSEHTVRFLDEHLPGVRSIALGAGRTLPDTGRPPDPDGFRRRHGLGRSRVLLFVGRKEPGKNYRMAVEALESLPDDVRVVLVGKDVDRLPLEHPRAQHVGVLDDEELVDAYAACDVFVFPSRNESFGMVFLDAWAQGKPVIGNARCGASAALVADGQDGFLCRDAGEIAERVRAILADPQLARRLGEAGREKVRSRYTWDVAAARAMDAFALAVGEVRA